VRDHFLDDWADWSSPSDLADKLDSCDNQRSNLKKDTFSKKKTFNPPKEDVNRTAPPKKNYYAKANDKPKPATY